MKRIVLGAALGVLAVAGLALMWVSASGSAGPQVIIKYDRESKYYHIRVLEYVKEGRRCLNFSKTQGIQSSMILGEPDKLDLAYTKTMIAALALHSAPKEVLLVGLGGASLPKFFQKQFPDIKLDIIEIDPDVVKVCQEWFEFKPAKNTRVLTMDGRMYLKQAKETYDVILLDAYAGDRIPFHLTTMEFNALVKSHLKPGGLMATNLWEHSINSFYIAELKTCQATFPQTYLCKSTGSGNVIVFGTLDEKAVSKDEWAARAEKLAAGKNLGFDLPALVRAEEEGLTGVKLYGTPLIDDMAPVDTLRRENPKTFEQEQAQ
jgi:spermidine synthase